MESKYIGIIVQRQDGKLLLQDDNYYLKVKVDDSDDIYNVIRNTINKSIGVSVYKVKKEYREIKNFENTNIFQKQNDLECFYLVEVCIYHEEYNFQNKEEIYEQMYNCPQKSFYEKYILRYQRYKDFLQGLFISLMMVITTLIITSGIFLINNQMIKMMIYIIIIAVICFYIFLIPIITNHLLDFFISDRLLKLSNISAITVGVLSILIILFY